MEKIKTDAQTAKSILEVGNRKITLGNHYVVKWINLNNETCYAEDIEKNTGSTFDNENVEFFINVPANAKTAY